MRGDGRERDDYDSPPNAPTTAMAEKAAAAALTFAAPGVVAVAVRKVRQRRRSA